MKSINARIAKELKVNESQVAATVDLLDEGSTVPFISRYRKEVTGGLDDTQLRTLEERLRYCRELEERRAAILSSIDEQGKLTDTLEQAITTADTKTTLEDLYLPYKPKRRTKGQIAIEAGLEPLANALFDDPNLTPETSALEFINTEKGITTIKEALDGAKYILMERFSEAAELVGKLRHYMQDQGDIAAVVMKGKEEEGRKFRDYFEHREPIKSAPSHRALALFRGRNEGILSLSLALNGRELDSREAHPAEGMIADFYDLSHQSRPADNWLTEVVRWTWRVKLLSHIETDLFSQLRERAELDAIDVFANNLGDLLLAAPAGQKVTIGLDPGLRTGVKIAVVDATGKVLDHGAMFPNPPQKKVQAASAQLVALCQKYKVELIAIGNGTASRETEQFVKQTLKDNPDLSHIRPVIVNESGASIYSASEFAAKEFPDLDVTIRGAVSIARRLQDPLAELVKIDPKSIGVGQYQHDVSQLQLARALDATVEDCVNAVGVEVNTASAPLLARVAGLSTTIANNIVDYRDQHGRFTNRESLKKVSRLGEKTFEQAAGFLRIYQGDNPLDESAVHPESYALVQAICQTSQQSVNDILGNRSALKKVNAKDFVSEQYGLPTVNDVLAELDKPGRDPRPEFKAAKFQDGVDDMKDLVPGMILEGTVTNVTNFGAFVDIGVHQDGLVHISALANEYVSDPRAVVKAGDIVKAKVMEVDIPRKRISLSMRLGDDASHAKTSEPNRGGGKQSSARQTPAKPNRKAQPKPQTAAMGSMGELLKAAMTKK